MTTIKIIYNDYYGELGFSRDFIVEYQNRKGCSYFEAICHLPIQGSARGRTDPIAVAILEEKGSEWSSGPNSVLAIREVPAEFKRYWRIREKPNGEEVVYADVWRYEQDLYYKEYIWE